MGSIKCGEFIDQQIDYVLLKKHSASWNSLVGLVWSVRLATVSEDHRLKCLRERC